MRIKQLYFFFLINSFIFLGQNNDIVIKVFLEDAYTGKNIKDAKVTLEGFEITEIVGEYDKKGKFYYFTEIPEGYNTVMVYHEKYNEKGFQDVNGLPKELKLKLYDPLNVIYDFKNGNEDVLKLNNHCKVYVEDPYKIAIDFNESCDQILYEVLKLCPELEAINPYYKQNANLTSDFSCDEYIGDNIYPTRGGYSFSKTRGLVSSNDYPILVFKKKDGLKFKRFNDPILSKLALNDFSPLLIVNLKVNYIGNKRYKKSFTKKLDIKNYNDKDLKAMIYTGSKAPLIGKNRFLHSKGYNEPTGESIQFNPHRFFYLIWNYQCSAFYTKKEKKLDTSLINLKYFGLGYLDQLEYFSKINNITIDDDIDQIYRNCN